MTWLGVPCVALLLSLTSAAVASQLTLTWVGSDGATQYVVEREASVGAFVEIGRTGAAVASYVDSTVSGRTTYCYRVRAANAAGYSDYSNIACAATAGAPGSFADDFDRPDTSVLGNGWTTVSGTLMIQAGQARNGSVKMMHAAVQAGLVGATQNISVTFASVNNNLGPRFALLLRYEDPQNYYTCYRQTGGSSLLRISKVVNGVETVLKSAPISNPSKEQFFTLGCQAQGTGLTLTFNGTVKLMAVDSTFSIGNVGISMGYPMSGTALVGSHRADNFSATVQ